MNKYAVWELKAQVFVNNTIYRLKENPQERDENFSWDKLPDIIYLQIKPHVYVWYGCGKRANELEERVAVYAKNHALIQLQCMNLIGK